MKRLDGWRAKIMLTTMSLLLAVVVASVTGEVLVRVFRPHPTPEELRRASLDYEATLFSRSAFPQEAQTGVLNDDVIYINRRGYRGRDFTVPKPHGTVRIVVMGGSAAFDVHASEGRDWPHLVESRLHAIGHDEVEVVNAGTPSHATFDSLGRLYAEIWMLEPDYVIVYHAWNDIKYFTWLNPDQSLLRGYRPAPTSDERSYLISNPFLYHTGPLDRFMCRSQLYVLTRSRYWGWRLGQRGPEGLRRSRRDTLTTRLPQLDAYPDWGPRQFELNLRLIAHSINEMGASPVFLTQARLVTRENGPSDLKRIAHHVVRLSHEALVRAFSDCDRAIEATAKTQGAAFLNIGEQLNGRSDYFTDHVHTSPQGSEAISLAVAGSLRDLIETEE